MTAFSFLSKVSAATAVLLAFSCMTYAGPIVPPSRDEGLLKVVSHVALPDHSIRYKSPQICDPDVKQYSGYLDKASDEHFFFWFFESRNDPTKDPLILWLNGGPACSSMTGLFMELGPCRVNDNGDGTTLNENSWNSNANVIFLDQPLNTGFSYGKNGTLTAVDAAKDVHTFLQLFLKEFPQYADLDFHVAGESYAGHYIPAVGTEIQNNKKGTSGSDASDSDDLPEINLKSLLIGNGLTDPLVQYKSYPEMACKSSHGPALNQTTCEQMESKVPGCSDLIEQCYETQNNATCAPAYGQCLIDIVVPYLLDGKNPYDVRKDSYSDLYYYKIQEGLEIYLNSPELREAIGAEVEEFKGCNTNYTLEFAANDWMRPYVELVPPLLEDGIPILIFAGDADFVCNWIGNKNWTIAMEWSGHDEFANAQDTAWFSPTANKQGGELRRTEDGRFAFLRVFDAGHMVPFDQGEYALDMFNQWVQGQLV